MATVRVSKKAAAAVDLPNANHANLFVDSADDEVKIKDSSGTVSLLGGAAGLSEDIVAALEGATTLDASNVVISADDFVVAADLTADMIAALEGSASPLDETNVVVGSADLTAYALDSDLTPISAITGLIVNLGIVDPSAGAGVVATAPKIGVRLNGAATELWLKTGASATSWTQLAVVV